MSSEESSKGWKVGEVGSRVVGGQVALAAEAWQVCSTPRSQAGGMDSLRKVLTSQGNKNAFTEVKGSPVFIYPRGGLRVNRKEEELMQLGDCPCLGRREKEAFWKEG